MRKTLIERLKNRKGTTLVETLATVVLLGLMGIALVSGIGAVQSAYRKVVRKANEQVLLSTTVIEMRDMVRNAKKYDSVSGRFQSEEGYWFKFTSSEEPKGIQVSYYMEKTGDPSRTIPLVPESNGEISDVYSAFDSISVTAGKVWIENLRVGETFLLPEDSKKYCLTVFDTDGGGA